MLRLSVRPEPSPKSFVMVFQQQEMLCLCCASSEAAIFICLSECFSLFPLVLLYAFEVSSKVSRL